MARPQQQKEKSEFEQKTLEIRRVTRVVEGGKRFSFRAAIVLGDLKGRVGIGVAKGGDVALAIEKATRQAKKDMISIPITEKGSIAHETSAKYGTAQVLLKPATEGRGLVAGGPVRAVCALVGIKHITAKIIRSKNKVNIARSTLEALKKL
ncbi:MAG: 30S ribosomal protein S5 [bacterium]|nr:30S ribosomal protein S5 [bacterium]